MTELTERQKQHLRKLGHSLKPIVRTGNAGLTETVLSEVDTALRDHELIKVKLIAEDRAQRRRFTERLCADTHARLVQAVGQIALLYRPNPSKRRPIELP